MSQDITIVVVEQRLSTQIETQSVDVVRVASQPVTIIERGIVGPSGPPGPTTRPYRKVTSEYWTSFAIDGVIEVDCSDGDTVIHLPIADVNNVGKALRVKKVDGTSYQAIVQAQAQNIDGAAPAFYLGYANEAYEFFSTGSGYSIY